MSLPESIWDDSTSFCKPIALQCPFETAKYYSIKPLFLPKSKFRDVNLLLFGGIPLFFFTFRFFRNDFPLFLKNRPKKFCFRLPTLPLSTVRRASVNSRWRLGLRYALLPFPVDVRKCRISTLNSSLEIWRPQQCCVLAYSVGCFDEGGGGGRGGEGRWFCGGIEDGLEVNAWVLPIEIQHLHPLPFHPHHFTHTLSLLSLSLLHTHTHTHTHTDIQGCQLLRFDFAVACPGQSLHVILAPNCDDHLQKIDPIFFLTQRLHSQPPPPSHGVSRGQLLKASLALF